LEGGVTLRDRRELLVVTDNKKRDEPLVFGFLNRLDNGIPDSLSRDDVDGPIVVAAAPVLVWPFDADACNTRAGGRLEFTTWEGSHENLLVREIH
jgi:hypothetical protein